MYIEHLSRLYVYATAQSNLHMLSVACGNSSEAAQPTLIAVIHALLCCNKVFVFAAVGVISINCEHVQGRCNVLLHAI